MRLTLPVASKNNKQAIWRNSLAMRCLLAFSIRANTLLIFKGTFNNSINRQQQQHQQISSNNNNNTVDALHGLRFISMAWIIAVHSYSFALRWLTFTTNPIQLGDTIYSSAFSQLLANGTFACDTFLLAGGFLVAHCALSIRAQNSLKAPLATLCSNLAHRYVRMAPLMMAIIAFSATLLRYFGSGQAWQNSTLMFDGWCRENWWTNALFVQNFVHRENMCLSHSWYSAVDMQLFVLAQLLLIVLLHLPRIGLLICCCLLIGAQITTGALTIMHNLPPVPLTSSALSENSLNLYFAEIYVKPYCRAAPYIIGLMLAFTMRTTKLGRIKLAKVR